VYGAARGPKPTARNNCTTTTVEELEGVTMVGTSVKSEFIDHKPDEGWQARCRAFKKGDVEVGEERRESEGVKE